MTDFYTVKETIEIRDLFRSIDDLQLQINEQISLQPELWLTIQEKLRLDWTYNSNAIEGSTLTRGETFFFLQEGLTVEGKPFKDFLDARNHAEAIDYLYQVIKDERPISQGLIKELNAFLLSGVTHTEAISQTGEKIKKPATPGEYKHRPNHVLQPDGTIHYYPDPLQVTNEMEVLCQWIQENLEAQHPIVTAAITHFNMARIHPFDDGNGREARLLMNLILMKRGYPPAIIKREKRRQYLETLRQADKGNLKGFVELIAYSLLHTQQVILADCKV